MEASTTTLRDLVEEHRDEILALAHRRGAHDVRLIGSVARGDESPESDIDFVVRFDRPRGLLNHAGLIRQLEDLLDVEVDVISEGGLRPGDEDTFLAGALTL